MKKIKLQIIASLIILILITSGLSFGFSPKKNIVVKENKDFYFVQITDTHVMHKIFDRNENSKNRLKNVLSYICSFEKKPDFIVITGDLTEWGGSRISGTLNCIAFTSCFYKKDGQLYADENYMIPVYTTPGNHDYNFNRNLKNYHKIINNNTNYVVNYKNTCLFFMDSGPNYYAKVYNWIDNIDGAGLYNCDIQWLENALNNCSCSYKIILMHHPAVNSRNDKGVMHGVIAHNREVFISLCQEHDVELVLTGHTHKSEVFDGYECVYSFNNSLNCSLYPTLFVQTDDCKEGIHYRNISMIDKDIFLENCVELNFR
ncbi:MAG: metallophosphoesterase [Candidatus Thermoplasmatota archaeon]|jgi:3',5'-cyclic AMP phosphodiesterase CpdA|nr:metallophosphoesterase [Candidatus Thermoplasmatota archaeon]